MKKTTTPKQKNSGKESKWFNENTYKVLSIISLSLNIVMAIFAFQPILNLINPKTDLSFTLGSQNTGEIFYNGSYMPYLIQEITISNNGTQPFKPYTFEMFLQVDGNWEKLKNVIFKTDTLKLDDNTIIYDWNSVDLFQTDKPISIESFFSGWAFVMLTPEQSTFLHRNDSQKFRLVAIRSDQKEFSMTNIFNRDPKQKTEPYTNPKSKIQIK